MCVILHVCVPESVWLSGLHTIKIILYMALTGANTERWLLHTTVSCRCTSGTHFTSSHSSTPGMRTPECIPQYAQQMLEYRKVGTVVHYVIVVAWIHEKIVELTLMILVCCSWSRLAKLARLNLPHMPTAPDDMKNVTLYSLMRRFRFEYFFQINRKAWEVKPHCYSLSILRKPLSIDSQLMKGRISSEWTGYR